MNDEHRIQPYYVNGGVRIWVGDVDEFACDAVAGEDRHAVWTTEKTETGILNRLKGKFKTEEEAVEFAKQLRDSYEDSPL